MRYKTMKFREICEKFSSDNKLMNKKLIELKSKLDIFEQKYLSIESAFDLSQKLVQHLKTENQLLRSSTPDLFAIPNPLDHLIVPTLAITDGTEIGDPSNVAPNQSKTTDNNPNSDLCKSDLIAIQYEKEIKEFRENCDLLSCLPLDRVVVTHEDQLNANSHLSGASDSENECDQRMDIDLDEMSTKMSETSEMETKMKCKYCGKRFPQMNALNEHKLLHKASDEQQIRCAEDFCGHQFDTKHDLKKHLKNIHRNGPKNKKFSSLKAKFQMNSSQNKQIFDCKQCNEEFPSIQSLRLHQKSVHNVVSTFKCKYSGCDQKFEKSSELRAHEEKHRKQKSTIDVTPTKGPVLPETNGGPQSTPTLVVKRAFPCKYEGCNSSYVNKTSLKKHEEKCHPNGLSIDAQPMATSETCVVTPAQDLGAKLQLLNLFFSEQQKHTQL